MSLSKVCIFDTETSGLLKKYDSLDQSPYILQFSYLIYDIAKRKILKVFNTYIRVDPSIIITEEITKLNGCTRELCDAGMPILDALVEFCTDLETCNILVAHNITFDMDMIRLECRRHETELDAVCPNYETCLTKPNLCTMRASTNICRLPGKTGKSYKWPTLLELHLHLFETKPENLHNSLVDILVCLRCYLKIKHTYHVENDAFEQMLIDNV
jgi:DNA polymerase III epsilon subunit-like protein